MMERDPLDASFEANLVELGRHASRPEGPSHELRTRCAKLLSGGTARRARRGNHRFRRPALLSGLGLAAAFALAFSVFFPSPNGATVRAATILAKLSEQMQGSEVFEVTLDNVAVDEVQIDGRFQLAGNSVAGDVHVIVNDDPGRGPVEVDAALAISPNSGWVLVRKLSIAEPEVQPILMALFPPGSETMLLLPPNTLKEVIDSGFQTDLDEIRALASGEAASFIKEVLRSGSDVGAMISHQPDGTVLLTITMDDTESLANLLRLAARAFGEEDAEIELDADDGKELIGATLQVLYDPAAETVRSFSISNIADVRGTITVTLSGATMDADLFDANRVKGPNTRVWDLSAFESVIKALEKSIRE